MVFHPRAPVIQLIKVGCLRDMWLCGGPRVLNFVPKRACLTFLALAIFWFFEAARSRRCFVLHPIKSCCKRVYRSTRLICIAGVMTRLCQGAQCMQARQSAHERRLLATPPALGGDRVFCNIRSSVSALRYNVAHLLWSSFSKLLEQ